MTISNVFSDSSELHPRLQARSFAACADGHLGLREQENVAREPESKEKQPQMVRPDALKGEDPQHIMGDLQRIDGMKLNAPNTLMLGEKVLRNKRSSVAQSLTLSQVEVPSAILKHPARHPSKKVPDVPLGSAPEPSDIGGIHRCCM
ncbi:hypothetical protein HPB52_022809 [Rhipicephalus sanguineus]|uniref:Uncharacterized protein n=1 Tax=Rhipicephalus sanguineus TaxID=34632 RepID=A0A9D4QH59_RHISA|nr:hypothetical protein HPB52_022809 [Rhipicephalus sanguineus]